MLGNFELFLYVSKAENGPWAQRMYVFARQGNGNLGLLYNWPVSTGRELVELAPNGQRAPSFTPQGYYELDPRPDVQASRVRAMASADALRDVLQLAEGRAADRPRDPTARAART